MNEIGKEMSIHEHYFYNLAPIAEFTNMEFSERWEEKVYRLGENHTKYEGLENVSNKKSNAGLLTQKVRIFLQDTQYSVLSEEDKISSKNVGDKNYKIRAKT